MEIFYKSANFEFSLKLEAMILVTLVNLLVTFAPMGVKEKGEATFTALMQILGLVGWF